MFAVTLNFKEMKKKEIYIMIFKKEDEKLEKNCLQNQESESFIQQISICNIKLAHPCVPTAPSKGGRASNSLPLAPLALGID